MWIDVAQNTDPWFELRIGKVTGSAIAKIMANFGKAFGEPAKKLAVDIALARITGKAQESGYSNAHMERGHEQEPIARALYESEYFCDVSNGGFFDNGNTGCSPDGLVGKDGVIEIKSVIPSQHYPRWKLNTIDSTYRWQVAFNLKETSRDWIDYISFCAEFTDDKKLFVKRITKEELQSDFEMIDTRLAAFESKVREARQVILG